jgi:hypothetical protein
MDNGALGGKVHHDRNQDHLNSIAYFDAIPLI